MIYGTSLLREFAAQYIEGGNPQVGPCSIDLTLRNEFIVTPGTVLAPSDGQGLIIQPGKFLLACTVEIITIPNHLMGQLVGKSTWARKGLIVECAGLCDPGYSGQPTLELANISNKPITLFPGEFIVQLTIQEVGGEVEPYGVRGRYQGDRGPQGPKP